MQCKECLADKPEDGFYAKDKTCKVCRTLKVRLNRAKKIDYYREYDRNRAGLPHRVEARAAYSKTDNGKEKRREAISRWVKNNPEKARSVQKAYSQTQQSKASKARWVSNNPLKRAAHTILGNAVRDGKVKKPGECSQCGGIGRIHGHHDDYYKPLEVIWVCAACHASIHKKESK